MKRRNVIKGLALLPLTSTALSSESSFASNIPAATDAMTTVGSESTVTSFMAETNIFRTINVEPLINCRGTFTIIGGSLERPAVRAAMEAASHNFVQYDELADGIGQRLADLTGAEWGMVSAGCAAGLKHITVACVTGGNPEKLIRIPNLTGFEKTEVIIPRYSRNVYDHAVRNVGVTIIHVTTAEELEKAINPKTAMIYMTGGAASETGQPLSLEVIAGIAKPKNVPVLIDVAAQNLTIPPVHLKRGATLVAYSGGKAICGPQCAGLMLGDKDILMSAWQASSPHHGPGRDNKVGREEMMGMLAAVEDWVKRDHSGEWKRWLSWLDTISKKVTGIEGVTTKVVEPAGLSNKSPVLNIIWDPKKLHVTGYDIAEEVGRSTPRIALGSSELPDGSTSINITTGQMQPGEEKIVADRVYQVLSKKREVKPETMASPSANLSGKWDVSIKFFNSTSQQTFTIEQDGNWIEGTHKAEIDLRTVTGTIEGNQVKLRSTVPLVGDNITYLFSGTVSADSISGDIHLGEYRTAKFTAKRNTVKAPRQKVMIPGGPPLAT
ncbi:MAG: aminotransferase class V-fold PLP-dependent enzyme [Bacteroidota bacterium]